MSNETITEPLPNNSESSSYSDQIYDEFWKDLVETDGVLDLEKVKAELADFHDVMHEVSQAYCEITGGALSKPNTLSCHIVAAAERHYLGKDDD